MIGKFPAFLNFNRLFLNLNRFICNLLPVLPDHCLDPGSRSMQAAGDPYHAAQGRACLLAAWEPGKVALRATVSGEAALKIVFCVIW